MTKELRNIATAVKRALRALPEEPEEIAAEFRRLGISGDRGECHTCPVANFITRIARPMLDKLGYGDVWDEGGYVWEEDYGASARWCFGFDCDSRRRGWRLPGNIHLFLRQFDRGEIELGEAKP